MTSDSMQIVYMNLIPRHIPSQIQHAHMKASGRNTCLSQLRGGGCTRSVEASKSQKMWKRNTTNNDKRVSML